MLPRKTPDFIEERILEREEQLEQLAMLMARLGPSTRRLEPGSAAERHAAETGHRMTRGCCLEAAANAHQGPPRRP